MPVVPATQEAEAGELLEPGRRKLQWGEVTPLHSSLGDRARLCLKKKTHTHKSKSCRDSTKNLCVPYNQFPLLLLFYMIIVCCLQLINQCWCIIVYESSCFIWIFLIFIYCPFYISRYDFILSCCISLGSSSLWQFLRFSLFLMTLIILEYWLDILYTVSQFGFVSYVFFIVVRLRLKVFGKKNTD